MSQPKRRSRKTKLVPRSAEGGDPEIEEMIEKEVQQIQIVNTMSLAQHSKKVNQDRKKSKSLQFKVDIEVEEWIDDELFIEENFAKMQSEQLSESLEKEIKEEADWTNEEYGKLWAEAASDSEDEEKPLNAYEKLIKNQIDPKVIAGLSKSSYDHDKPKVFDQEPSKVSDQEKSKFSDQDNPNVSKQGQAKNPPEKEVIYQVKAATSKAPPTKPIINVLQPEHSAKRKINETLEEKLKPVLKINVVFDPPENTKGNLDQSKCEETNTVGKSPETGVKQDQICSNKDTVYLVPAKDSTPNERNDDNGSKKRRIESSSFAVSNVSKTTEEPSTSQSIENIDDILKNPIYYIQLNEDTEKINKMYLGHTFKESVLKVNNKKTSISKSKDKNSVSLLHIDVSEDQILSVTNELSVLDEVCKDLSIEIRNILGCVRFVNTVISREDALLEYVFRQWFDSRKGVTPGIVPLYYKCYICNEGWWHLSPFREHIKKHSHVQLNIEKYRQEYNIIAHDTNSSALYKTFPIDNECWRCGNSHSFHTGSNDRFFKCDACGSDVNNCIALLEHTGVCLSVWKREMSKQKTKSVKAFKCKICTLIFFTNEQLHKHQYIYHVPRSDYPMLKTVRQCGLCNQNYSVHLFHVCRLKIQKHVCKFCNKHFSSTFALNMHLEMMKVNVKCKFCDEVLKIDCYKTNHLLGHTDKFVKVYKCLQCEDNIIIEGLEMLRLHLIHVHKGARLTESIAEIVIPKKLCENKCATEYTYQAKIPKHFKPIILRTSNEIIKPNKTTIDTMNDNSSEITEQDISKDTSIAETETMSDTKTETMSDTKTETMSDTKTETMSDTKTETISDTKTETVSNTKTETMSDTKTETMSDTKTETMSDTKTETMSDTKTETMSDTKTENEESNPEITPTIKIENEEFTESMPKIKIENVMENYYEEDESHIDNEDHEELNPMEPQVKIEMDVTEVDETELLTFEEVDIKKEITDELNTESAKATTRDKFNEQLQDFLSKMTDDNNESIDGLKDNVLVCLSCSFEGTKREYNKHLKECTEGTTGNWDERECTKCNKVFPTFKKFAKHLTIHGYNLCYCKECDLDFKSYYSWSIHLKTHVTMMFTRVKLVSNDAKVFICRKCKDIVQRNMFFKHWEVHLHEKVNYDVGYEQTGSVSQELINSIINILLEPIKRKLPKTCVACGRAFSRANEGKRHLVEHLLRAAAERRSNNEPLQCQVCGAGFGKSDGFRGHMRNHASLPVYHCELCDKTFSDSSNFVKHKKVHSVVAYVCDVCNKKYMSKDSLVAHIASHCDEPIKCILCPDKLFYSESIYRRHVRTIHDKKSNYSCFVCRVKFSSLRDKWDHDWERHQMRTYLADCPKCDVKYRKYSDLKKHLIEVHGIKRK